MSPSACWKLEFVRRCSSRKVINIRSLPHLSQQIGCSQGGYRLLRPQDQSLTFRLCYRLEVYQSALVSQGASVVYIGNQYHKSYWKWIISNIHLLSKRTLRHLHERTSYEGLITDPIIQPCSKQIALLKAKERIVFKIDFYLLA